MVNISKHTPAKLQLSTLCLTRILVTFFQAVTPEVEKSITAFNRLISNLLGQKLLEEISQQSQLLTKIPTTYNSSSRGANALFWPLRTLCSMYYTIRQNIHTHKIISKNIFKYSKLSLKYLWGKNKAKPPVKQTNKQNLFQRKLSTLTVITNTIC